MIAGLIVLGIALTALIRRIKELGRICQRAPPRAAQRSAKTNHPRVQCRWPVHHKGRYGTVWDGTARHSTVRYDTVRYGTARYHPHPRHHHHHQSSSFIIYHPLSII
eukprot:1142729-Karenia_brevis.AAC.1